MNDLIKMFYDPPPTPPIDMPALWHLAKIPWDKALQLFYLAGFKDGVVVGALVALLLMPSRKGG
jgi:hypothetical protein